MRAETKVLGSRLAGLPAFCCLPQELVDLGKWGEMEIWPIRPALCRWPAGACGRDGNFHQVGCDAARKKDLCPGPPLRKEGWLLAHPPDRLCRVTAVVQRLQRNPSFAFRSAGQLPNMVREHGSSTTPGAGVRGAVLSFRGASLTVHYGKLRKLFSQIRYRPGGASSWAPGIPHWAQHPFRFPRPRCRMLGSTRPLTGHGQSHPPSGDKHLTTIASLVILQRSYDLGIYITYAIVGDRFMRRQGLHWVDHMGRRVPDLSGRSLIVIAGGLFFSTFSVPAIVIGEVVCWLWNDCVFGALGVSWVREGRPKAFRCTHERLGRRTIEKYLYISVFPNPTSTLKTPKSGGTRWPGFALGPHRAEPTNAPLPRPLTRGPNLPRSSLSLPLRGTQNLLRRAPIITQSENPTKQSQRGNRSRQRRRSYSVHNGPESD